MTDNFKSGMEDFLGTPEGKRLLSKKHELEGIANSTDGQTVKKILGGSKIEEAVISGDVAKLASAIQSVLKTAEGERFASQLKELMK